MITVSEANKMAQTCLTPSCVTTDCVQENAIKDKSIHFTVGPIGLGLQTEPLNNNNIAHASRLFQTLQYQPRYCAKAAKTNTQPILRDSKFAVDH